MTSEEREIPPCQRCQKPHVTAQGRQACTGHVKTDRDSYVPGQNRVPLPEPRPCRKPPINGQSVCGAHGGMAPQNQQAGARRLHEAKLIDGVRQLIPEVEDRTQITDPLETLLGLASEANAFRESLRILANRLGDELRYGGTGAAGEQLRAEVAVYRAALKDTADLLVAIAKLDIENKLAASAVARDQLYHHVLRSILSEFGIELSDPEVAGKVARHLRAV